MKLVTAPTQPPKQGFMASLSECRLFLAGSIEMGKARHWQKEVIERYKDVRDLTILNPRRDDWDPTWSQSPDNPKLLEQIDWELDHLTTADVVLFYIQAGTQSPITLMELTLMLGKGADESDLIVVCEPGFWREANVVRTCNRFGIEVLKDLTSGLWELDNRLGV